MSRFEKETLGLRLSFNPLERFVDIIRNLTTATTDKLGDRNNGEAVYIAGEIVAMRPMMTKHGRAMAQVEIEDLAGSVRAVAFPEYYEKYASLLKEDNMVFVMGTVDRGSERPGLQIQEVMPLTDAAARVTEKIKISLKREAMDAKLLDNLQEVLRRHTGERQVYIEVMQADGKRVLIKAGREGCVRPSHEFATDVSRLLGPDALRMVPRAPVAIARSFGRNGNGRNGGNGD